MTSNKKLIISIFAVLVALFILVPMASGFGERIAMGDPQSLDSRASYAQAEAELYRARGDFYQTLPSVFTSGGTAALQVGIAVLVVALALGILALMVSASFTLSTGGIVRVIVANRTTPKAENLLSSGRDLGLPPGTSYVAPENLVANHLRHRGIDVSGFSGTDRNQTVVDANLVDVKPGTPGDRDPGSVRPDTRANAGDRNQNGRPSSPGFRPKNGQGKKGKGSLWRK